MKKNLVLVVILTFLFSCVEDDGRSIYRSGSGEYRSRNFNRTASTFIRRVKPSESMQAGLPKRSSYDLAQDEMSGLNGNDDYLNEMHISRDIMPDEDYQGHFKVGNPYQVYGVNYIPQDYEEFEETGTASWYGDDFDGKATANGETYNMQHMTAAHPTLPLPSLIRVTNLRNGRSVIVRVNDRGPFAKERVIDVSEKAAVLLGFRDVGTTEVKIELLRNNTDEMLKRLRIKN